MNEKELFTEFEKRNQIYKIKKEFNGQKNFKEYSIEVNKFITTNALKMLVDNEERTKRNLIEEKYLTKTDRKDVDWERIITTQNLIDFQKCQKAEEKTFIVQKPILRIDNFNENIEIFWTKQPFFYDKQCVFWFWNEKESKYEMVDEIDVMNAMDDILGFEGQTIHSTIKNNYMEAFKRVGRKHKPKEAPIRWVQFKNKAYSIRSDNIYDVKSNYFFTNPIPWNVGNSEETPTMDKLFKEWVGESYVQTLYEIISYCCYRKYPIQTLFCLYGVGRNGKSCFLNLIQKFIGKDNISSSDLDRLVGVGSSRFESIKLYKKLACMMGETNFGILDNSSFLKKLTGTDLIGFEMKGKTPFDEHNYAKIIIASNSLPSSNDTSEGFYRRWIIVDFPNKFPEGKDILLTIPDVEYENLAKKCCRMLKRLLSDGCFTNQGSIEERKDKYIMASNPFPMFFQSHCEPDPEGFIRYSELYTHYVNFLREMNRRIVTKKEFSDVLVMEGLEARKTSKRLGDAWISDRYIENYKFVTFVTFIPKIQVSSSYRENGVGKKVRESRKSQNLLFLKCWYCNLTPCIGFDDTGKPICEFCHSKVGHSEISIGNEP